MNFLKYMLAKLWKTGFFLHNLFYPFKFFEFVNVRHKRPLMPCVMLCVEKLDTPKN